MFYCALVFSVSAVQFCPCATAGPTPRRQCMAHQYFNTTKCYTFFPRSIRLHTLALFHVSYYWFTIFVSLYVWLQGHLTWNEKRERSFSNMYINCNFKYLLSSFAFHRYQLFTYCYNAMYIYVHIYNILNATKIITKERWKFLLWKYVNITNAQCTSGILNEENISKRREKETFYSLSISIFSYLMHTAIASHGIS